MAPINALHVSLFTIVVIVVGNYLLGRDVARWAPTTSDPFYARSLARWLWFGGTSGVFLIGFALADRRVASYEFVAWAFALALGHVVKHAGERSVRG